VAGARRRRRALLLGLLLAAGCASGPRVISREPEPRPSVEQIRVDVFDGQRAVLELQIAVDNPGPALALVSAEYEVLVEGRVFAVGTTRLDGRLEADGRTALALPIALAYLDLPLRARNRIRAGEPLALVVRGQLTAHAVGGTRRLGFDGEVEARVYGDPG
jgi:hypothetical protein